MRQNLGVPPTNPADAVTKTWIEQGATTLSNKTLGPGTVLGQNVVPVSTASYAIPVGGQPYQAIVISADVTTPSLASGLPGQPLTISVQQDSNGNHAFNWANLANVYWSVNEPPITSQPAYARTTVTLVCDGSVWIETGRQSLTSYVKNSWYSSKGTILAGNGATGAQALAVGANTRVLTLDSTAPLGMDWYNLPADVSYLQCLGARTVGLGDNTLGIKLQRKVSFVNVTFRGGTEDSTGSSTFELRQNGTTVAGTSTSVSAGSLVAGQTISGNFVFQDGDILTVYTSAVSSGTPGTGLVVDMEGYAI